MPWFPEFYSAVELARRQTRTAGLTDPVGQYFNALNNGDTHVLEYTWPGAVTVYDPRAGEIRGHRKLRRFVLPESNLPGRTPGKNGNSCHHTCSRASGRGVAGASGCRRPGIHLAGGRRRRFPGRSVGGISHLLQQVAGGRAALRQAADSQSSGTSNPVTSSAATLRLWKPVTPRPP